jgi:hypothetical protein
MRFSLLVAVVLFVACSDAVDTAGREYAASPGLGEEFEIRVGEWVLIDAANLELRFLEVAEDSRCPDNPTIECVWIGDAAVVIETIFSNAEAQHDTLHTTLEPRSVDVGPLALTLLALAPYPQDVTPIPAEDYVATLSIVER